MASVIYLIVSVGLLALLVLSMLSIVYVSLKNGISPMPSSAKARRIVVDELNRYSSGSADPIKGLIVEAGSGWGTLALSIARQAKGWRIIGIENSPVPLWFSHILLIIFGHVHKNLHADLMFISGDIYAYGYEKADVVVCYLYPGAMKKLSPILERKLKQTGQIISIGFAMSDWQPERVLICKDLFRTKVYVYSAKSNDSKRSAIN